ncbi:putative IMP dehydrogenase/GMP reductase [Trifolium medium]|uniref:Putative IMP dehydrogenase/GMP reductase n=1 Tax=Trifolium medium TaxID=97028 RepID=A0A392Q0G2_9FABA|nr:putative IMP dehydrogenase/GMP reductase [Trifolium medium]
MPSGKIIVTLDDVHCLLHLPIEGHLLDHQGILTKSEAVALMVEFIGSSPANAHREVTSTKGAHARFTYLKCTHSVHLRTARQAEKDRDYATMVYISLAHLSRPCLIVACHAEKDGD